MNTSGIIFLSLGVLTIVVPIFIAIIKQDKVYTAFSVMSFFWFMFFPAVNYSNPTKSDVKEDKTIYVEEDSVGLDVNGDTLYNYSTYRLEWLPEWKYGHKQK